jgi:glycerophosphoryl diester phosphodiesterase
MTASRNTPFRRVGHKGADLLAPGNTRASFDAALAAGVDMIEFDVLPERESPSAYARAAPPARRQRLMLAHDYEHEPELSLEQGLDHLASGAFAGLEFDVDLKLPGYELQVIEALRERGLESRVLISSMHRVSLATIRREAPELRVGWSVPNLRRDPFRRPLLRPGALAALYGARAVLPSRAAAAIRSGACHALMAHWRLVTPRLVRAIDRAGGELYVWTVDDPQRIRSLHALGVTGVISNDPRLFTALV